MLRRDANPLSRLPNELFELVLRHCDFGSITALRRTSKAHAARCMSPAFKAYFSHQETDLSEPSLRRLMRLASHPQLGPAVTDLTVTAVSYDTTLWENILHGSIGRQSSTVNNHVNLIITKLIPHIRKLAQLRQAWLRQSDEHAAHMLAGAFTGLQSLRTLKLDARVVQVPSSEPHDDWLEARVQDASSRGEVDWISLWADCSRVLDIVTQAVGHGGANIESLSVFDGCFGKVSSWRFHQNFLRVLQPGTLHKNFTAAAAKLTTLNLTFSTLTYTPDGLPDQGNISNVPAVRLSSRPRLIAANAGQGTADFGEIAQFLKTTSQLDTLSLHMYNTLRGHPVVYSQVIDRIADEVRLPNLHRLTLRGMWCTTDALLRFLRAHPDITELNFMEIHLLGPLSSWDRVFEALRQKLRNLSKVYLENLWYGRGNLLPLDSKDKKFSSDSDLTYRGRNGQACIVYARSIGTAELKKGIELAASTTTPASTRGRGDRTTMAWLKQRYIDYGPPRCPSGPL